MHNKCMGLYGNLAKLERMRDRDGDRDRLKIGTLNCKGLAHEKKRKDVFNWLRQKKNLTYVVYRRRIFKIAKENKQGGNPNGTMRLSLAAWTAKVVGLLFYLTIHLNMCYTM